MAEFLRRVLKLVAIRQADLLSRLDPHPAETHLLLAEVGYPCPRHPSLLLPRPCPLLPLI